MHSYDMVQGLLWGDAACCHFFTSIKMRSGGVMCALRNHLRGADKTAERGFFLSADIKTVFCVNG